MNLRVGDPFSGHEAISVASLVTPVMLCGGGGTRLWPLSNSSKPKQFQHLLTPVSPFQMTLQRLESSGYGKAVIVTGSAYQRLVSKQMRVQEYAPSMVVIEPSPKNSAAAVVAAAVALSATDPEAIMLVTPSDHKIDHPSVLDQAVALGLADVQKGKIVTFGIKPIRAASEYGWIEPADRLKVISPVKSFVEKPDKATATKLLNSNIWLWNSGIFLMSARTLLQEAAEHTPVLLKAVRASVGAGSSNDGKLLLQAEAWQAVESHAIDTAIMEKSRNLRVIKISAGWSDLGDWNAIWRESAKDQTGVVAVGDVASISCRNSLLRSSDVDGPHLVGIGLDDMVAVATRDSVLVTPRNRAQDVRLATSFGLTDRGSANPSHTEKPWGSFDILGAGAGYQIKRLTVLPGGQLSLQSHRFRSEHWVVVQGTASVTRGTESSDIEVDGAIYIPKGIVHRLENRSEQTLVLVEVQIGAHIAEDDIVRYVDAYGRA